MKQFARRALTRAGQLVLDPLERRQEALRKQLVTRLDRLDARVNEALTREQQNASLLAALGPRARRGPANRGRPLPRRGADLAPPHSDTHAASAFAHDIDTLSACPCCGHAEYTQVSEYNRFLLVASAPDACAARYYYSLCHRCGVVYARRRPVGPRYRQLLERFEDTLGRPKKGGSGADVFGSRQLSLEDAARIRAYAAQGVFVSEASPLRRQSIPALLRDRLAVSPHVEILGSLLELDAPRVLEIRPRFGAIGGALRRLYGGDTFALPIFEAQQLIAAEVYGAHADARLDFDHFDIPYDGDFDLVVANHMLTHAVRPAEFLQTVRARLRPGGHLYLYNEPDEADFLDGRKSMFKTLNPFHLQTFDLASLTRALEHGGFHVRFAAHHQGNCVVLAAVGDPAGAEPLPARQRTRRLAKYAAARDRAIVLLPDTLKGHFKDEWDDVLARAFAAGTVGLDPAGDLRITGAPA